jgi:hypothetical protein
MMKVVANVVFKSGFEKMYYLDVNRDNPKEFIEESMSVFRKKWLSDLDGGCFMFQTQQGRSVVLDMSSIAGIELFLS